MDFESMSQEILRLARDYPLRREMARIGFERVRSMYTCEQFIESYRRIYKEAGEAGARWQG
jgi:glycosyltransferase involved in cell wall biosynthesis